MLTVTLSAAEFTEVPTSLMRRLRSHIEDGRVQYSFRTGAVSLSSSTPASIKLLRAVDFDRQATGLLAHLHDEREASEMTVDDIDLVF